MEQQSLSDLTKELLPILQAYQSDKELTITNATQELGSQPGENYTSIVMRIRICGKLKNNQDYEMPLIIKYNPRHRPISKTMGTDNCYHNEAVFYKNFGPHMTKIVPQCIHADTDKVIMFDLNEDGFMLANRMNVLELDLDHAVLAMQALAELHAKSLGIKLANEEKFEETLKSLTEINFNAARENNPFEVFLNDAFKLTTEHLQSIQPQTDEIKKVVKHCEEKKNAYKECVELLFNTGTSDKRFHVLTHADCWINNLLYKYNSAGKPVAVKLIDYQFIRHNSGCMDVHYVIYSSTDTNVIIQSYDQLLQLYHKTLQKYLREINIAENYIQALSMEWLSDEMAKYSFYGLAIFSISLHGLLAEEVIDIDAIEEGDMCDLKLDITEKKSERIRLLSTHYGRTYL